MEHPMPTVERESVDGTCPECGATALERYPVPSEGGWFMAVKCQACLHSVERARWNRMGYVVRLEDVVL